VCAREEGWSGSVDSSQILLVDSKACCYDRIWVTMSILERFSSINTHIQSCQTLHKMGLFTIGRFFGLIYCWYHSTAVYTQHVFLVTFAMSHLCTTTVTGCSFHCTQFWGFAMHSEHDMIVYNNKFATYSYWTNRVHAITTHNIIL